MVLPAPQEMLNRLRELPQLDEVFGLLAKPDAPRVAVVGGVGRDLLLGRGPLDVDLVVEGPLDRLITALGRTTGNHARFETATLATDAGPVDVARARVETYERPGALPHVEPATIEADLARRDFTVNAIAVPLAGAEAGSVLAHPDALTDLEGHRLAVIHDRSFTDDPTRLFRVARYRARLGFEITPETIRLAEEALATDALSTISGSRVGNELRLLASEPDPVAALTAISELNLDTAIHPDFGIADQAATLRAALEELPADGNPSLLALAVASERISPNQLRQLLDELGLAAQERDVILAVTRDVMGLNERLNLATTPSQIATAAGGSPSEALALSSARASEGARRNARRWLDELRWKKLEIDGDVLIKNGMTPGPALGRALQAARDAMLDGTAPDRESQLAAALAADSGH